VLKLDHRIPSTDDLHGVVRANSWILRKSCTRRPSGEEDNDCANEQQARKYQAAEVEDITGRMVIAVADRERAGTGVQVTRPAARPTVHIGVAEPTVAFGQALATQCLRILVPEIAVTVLVRSSDHDAFEGLWLPAGLSLRQKTPW